MNKLDPDLVQQALNQHMAEIMILRVLIISVLETCPSKPQIKTMFQASIESLCANAPSGTDPEMIVEIRARAQVYLQQLLVK